ncbi:hypothetical protein KVP09_12825 [Alcaligenaceae bacterium CGII-47]|nr:hypothetical protein [Alcaligenaceae bacterium CGII-47]
MLTACASMTSVPPGTPVQQVLAQFGQASYTCTNRDGSERMIWSQQPYGQYAWGTNVNATGNIEGIVPILTDEHFDVLSSGSWTPDQVRCEFGRPAIIDTVGLPSSREIVWSYRYKQSHVWNSLMYVHFGTDGQTVTRFYPGPDPMYDRNDMRIPF